MDDAQASQAQAGPTGGHHASSTTPAMRCHHASAKASLRSSAVEALHEQVLRTLKRAP